MHNNSIQQTLSDFSGLVLQSAMIKVNKSQKEFFYRDITLLSLDDFSLRQTYKIRVFGDQVNCTLQKNDLVVYVNSFIYCSSPETMHLEFVNQKSFLLIGEQEISNWKGKDYFNQLQKKYLNVIERLFMKELEQDIQHLNIQYKNQIIQEDSYESNDYYGIICEKGNVLELETKQKYRDIQFMNINSDNKLQIYQFRFFGQRANDPVKINQMIYIKNSEIYKKGKIIYLTNLNGRNPTNVFIGVQQIQRNIDANILKKIQYQLEQKRDLMNSLYSKQEKNKVLSKSKKIKKKSR